jgi:hypothetical protein
MRIMDSQFIISNIREPDIFTQVFLPLSSESDDQRDSSADSAQQQSSEQKDSAIALSIRTLQEESLQISELSEMERNYAAEVSSLLRQLIEPLNVAYHIKPGSVSNRDATLSDVVLTPQGMLFFMHNHGTINSKTLENLPSEVLVKILAEVVPQIKKVMIDKRQKISARVATLEKIGREFKKIAPSVNPRARAPQVAQEQLVAPQIYAAGGKEKGSGKSQSAMNAALSE